MKEIKVKRDNTNLPEVLFEAEEIGGFVELNDYLKKHTVSMTINGTERNVKERMRLMKGDTLIIKEV